MARRRSRRSAFQVRVSPAGSGGSGGEFESGWTSFDGGAVTFGAATGSEVAGPADFVVQQARLERPVSKDTAKGPTSAYLAGLLDGSQTTPVDVEIQEVGSDGEPEGRRLVYRVVVLTEYAVLGLESSSARLPTERFVFVAKDLEIARV